MSLPDFRSGQQREPAPHGAPGQTRSPLRTPLLIGGCAAAFLALCLVIALVVWATVLRPASEPVAGPTVAGPATPSQQPSGPSGEYIPSGSAEPLGDPTTLAPVPMRPCTVRSDLAPDDGEAAVVRADLLQYDLQPGWDPRMDFEGQAMYSVRNAASAQVVQNGWWSVATVGTVDFPEEEGGYPGAEEAARAIFQCNVTSDESQGLFSDPARIHDLRDEPITVDGSPGWILRATIEVAPEQGFTRTAAWDYVVIVVDTPGGPAVFHGGAATGMPQQVADLEAIIASLRVVG